MRRNVWWLYLVGAAIVGTLYFVGPAWAKTGPVLNLIALSSVIAILIGIRLNSPSPRLPWALFAAGLLLFLGGDVVTYNYSTFFYVAQAPFPSLGDALYVAVYPVLVAGLLILIRERSPERDVDALVDSLIFTIGIATLSWVFLMAPNAHNPDFNLFQKATAIAYPFGDLLLLGMLARLAVGAGRRNAAFSLLAMSILSLLVTDTIYTYILVTSTYGGSGSLLDAGWAMFYVFWGAAALHPGMKALSERGSVRADRLPRLRLVLLAAGALMVPLIRIVVLAAGLPRDEPVMIAVSIALLSLVGVRMVGLVRRHERAEARERALRRASGALVAATSFEDITDAVAAAVQTVAGDEATARLLRQEPEDGPALPDVLRTRVGGETVFVRDPGPELADAAAAPTTVHESMVMVPLVVGEEPWGGLCVWAAHTQLSQGVPALEGLASQTALALERARLSENLHRRQAEAWLGSLVRNATDIITLTEADGRIRYQSPSVERVLGYDAKEMMGGFLGDLIHPEDRPRFMSLVTEPAVAPALIEARWRHRDGTWLHVETQRNDLRADPNVGAVVLNSRDVSERKAFEEQLAHQAFHDSTTGLANRALFQDRVSHALERQHRGEQTMAVIFMDLDDFKAVNDTLGHAAGDLLLVEVASRLHGALRAVDTAARMGGDEFAVLLEESTGEFAAEVAERILAALGPPVTLEGRDVPIRASLGIAMGDGLSPAQTTELLRNADVAMYMAKSRGKARYQLFETNMHAAALERLEVKADLQHAIERDQLVLHFQPILELTSGRTIGVEALVRWNHPTRGLVPPLEFIPLAEEGGLIVEIGRWVLEQACTEAVALQQALPPGQSLAMSVNLSARQLQQDDLVNDVERVLRESRLDPELLIVEITETVMMADMDLSVRRLQALKALGVRVAVDDFGTGYSSLNYIRQFPVDVLKIDKSFVDGLNADGELSALTATIIELARVLNLRPVAEGIETDGQLDRLIELGCDYGQGFLFAKPADAPSIHELLASGGAEDQLSA